MPDEPMTLVERLRNPQYVSQPNGDAILDTKRTLADMRAAADRIEVQQAFGRAAAEMIDKSGS
jgi:hypothetical protein